MIARVIPAFAYAFKPAGDCITTHTADRFHLYDGQPVRLRVGEAEAIDLVVSNDRQRPIALIAVDGCLYDTAGPFGTKAPTRCDCVLICDEKAHFIEFKHGQAKNRTDRVKECIPQLAATISDFHRRGIIPDGSTVRAIACVGFTEQEPPRGASVEARIVQLNRLTPATVVVELAVSNQTTFN